MTASTAFLAGLAHDAFVIADRPPQGIQWRGASSLLQSIINSLPVVIYAFDADGTVLLAEGRALDGMYSAPGASVGRSIFEVFEDESETHRHFRRALAGEAHTADITLRRNRRSYRVWYTPWRDGEDRITMVSGLALDITEVTQADRELRESMRWLASFLEHLPVAIFRVDAQGVLQLAQGAILPQNVQPLVGKPIGEMHARYPRLVRAIRAALRGEDQALSVRESGRDYEVLVHSMRNGTGDRGAIGVLFDVTEQRKALAVAAENEWRSRFLAEISHELRTPLNSVIGFADLLVRPEFDPLTERQHRHVANIRAGAQHLLELINQLLDHSKLRAGHIEVARECVNAGEVLEEVAEHMAPSAAAAGIALTIDVRAARPAAADRRRLFQIVLNLVSNALKFTPAGGRVTLRCYRRFGTVTVVVADTGVGIARQDQERIFEDYYQVPGLGPAGRHGTGLGLALSRRLARAMGGELMVRSAIGRGSTFLVSLPIWTGSMWGLPRP